MYITLNSGYAKGVTQGGKKMLNNVIEMLRGEKQRIDNALNALEGSTVATEVPTRTPEVSEVATPIRHKRPSMSKSARKKISEAQKARWAKSKAAPQVARAA